MFADIIKSNINKTEGAEFKYLKRLLKLYVNAKDYVNICWAMLADENKKDGTGWDFNDCKSMSLTEITSMIQETSIKNSCGLKNFKSFENLMDKTYTSMKLLAMNASKYASLSSDGIAPMITIFPFIDKYIHTENSEFNTSMINLFNYSQQGVYQDYKQELLKMCPIIKKDEKFVIQKMQELSIDIEKYRNCFSYSVDAGAINTAIVNARVLRKKIIMDKNNNKKFQLLVDKIGNYSELGTEFSNIIRADSNDITQFKRKACLKLGGLDNFEKAMDIVARDLQQKIDNYESKN